MHSRRTARSAPDQRRVRALQQPSHHRRRNIAPTPPPRGKGPEGEAMMTARTGALSRPTLAHERVHVPLPGFPPHPPYKLPNEGRNARDDLCGGPGGNRGGAPGSRRAHGATTGDAVGSCRPGLLKQLSKPPASPLLRKTARGRGRGLRMLRTLLDTAIPADVLPGCATVRPN